MHKTAKNHSKKGKKCPFGACFVFLSFIFKDYTKLELELAHDVKICNDLITGQEIKLEKVGKKTILTIPNWKMHSAILLKYDK